MGYYGVLGVPDFFGIIFDGCSSGKRRIRVELLVFK